MTSAGREAEALPSRAAPRRAMRAAITPSIGVQAGQGFQGATASGEHVRVGALEVVAISNVLAAMTHSVVGSISWRPAVRDEYAQRATSLFYREQHRLARRGGGFHGFPPLLTAHRPSPHSRSSGTLDTPDAARADSTLESGGRTDRLLSSCDPKTDRHLMPPFPLPSRGSTWAAITRAPPPGVRAVNFCHPEYARVRGARRPQVVSHVARFSHRLFSGAGGLELARTAPGDVRLAVR